MERSMASICCGVDRHVQFLEHLEHAHMRNPARTAAREDESDAQPVRRRLLRRGLLRRGQACGAGKPEKSQ
jgi:hypothetical protein